MYSLSFYRFHYHFFNQMIFISIDSYESKFEFTTIIITIIFTNSRYLPYTFRVCYLQNYKIIHIVAQSRRVEENTSMWPKSVNRLILLNFCLFIYIFFTKPLQKHTNACVHMPAVIRHVTSRAVLDGTRRTVQPQALELKNFLYEDTWPLLVCRVAPK